MLTRPKLIARSPRGFALMLVLLLHCAAATGARQERHIENWRPVHYDVTLAFDDKLSTLTRAETKINIVVLRAPLSVVDLDFGALPVDGVRVGDEAARFEQRAGRLNVLLPYPAQAQAHLIVSVTYHGRPADGLILTNDRDDHPSATGDNWPDRVHNWIPVLDHPSAKATVTFSVTAPQQFTVVANGSYAGGGSEELRRTWLYDEHAPIPPYCMIVAVGQFAKVTPSQPASDSISKPLA